MNIKTSISKDKTELTVYVSMPLRDKKEPKKQLKTEDVILELEKDGFEITKVLRPVHLLNISEARRSGVAIFELKVEKPKKKKKTAKKKHTTSEILDELTELSQEFGGYEELDENPLVHEAAANLKLNLSKDKE